MNRKAAGIFKHHKQILPLLLLTAYCMDAVVASIRGTIVMAGETYGFAPGANHYIAFGAVAVNFLIYFFFRPLYKYSLALTIAPGLFNLLIFSAPTTTYFLAVGSLKISFQPAAFFSGLLAYILNFNRINQYLVRNLLTRTPEEAARHETELIEEQTEKFKERYRPYSTAELTEIVTAGKLIPAALEAARQLLNERQSQSS